MTKLAMEKYRDCPCCGAVDGGECDDPEGPITLVINNVTGKWSVDCLVCDAEGPLADTAKEAVEKWNAQ